MLPKNFTKGGKPTAETTYEKSSRTSVRFDIGDFDKLVDRIVRDIKKGKDVQPSDYYPAVCKRGGKTRELPITYVSLIVAIQSYLDERMMSSRKVRPHDLFGDNYPGRTK